MSDQDLPLFQSTGVAVKRTAMTVSEVTSQIKSNLESKFSEIWIQGEISNLKAASSGHVYFSLKDDGATISAAAFGWGRKKVTFDLRDGLEVICRGNVSVYPPRGNYQLLVDTIEPLGAGALQLAFDQLKQKLQAAGLFDQKRKRPIPKYPSKIVVITSPQAAALRDVLTVLKRRAPFVDVLLIPALVQGEDAPTKLIQALKVANHYKLGEVILLTRGGGSMEDLWSFNHEELARLIASSEIPVISAVGHEIDFTIADFVADLRAPTPSAGAEILTQHWVELRERTRQLHERLFHSFKRDLLLKKRTLEALSAKLKNPKDQLREKSQRLDELSMSLERTMKLILERKGGTLERLAMQLQAQNPKDQLREKSKHVNELSLALGRVMKLTIERKQSSLERLSSKLNALSPLNVLSRGYALVQNATGDKKVIRSAGEVKKGQKLSLRFSDGEVEVKSE